MFTKYIEVYSTLNMENFFAAKNALADHDIPFKDTSANNQLRLSFNNPRGNNYLLSRDGSVKTIYRLSVKKEDEYRAREVLRRI